LRIINRIVVVSSKIIAHDITQLPSVGCGMTAKRARKSVCPVRGWREDGRMADPKQRSMMLGLQRAE